MNGVRRTSFYHSRAPDAAFALSLMQAFAPAWNQYRVLDMSLRATIRFAQAAERKAVLMKAAQSGKIERIPALVFSDAL